MNERFYLYITFTLLFVVTLLGLFVHLMEPDSIVYALVSMEMFQHSDYCNIMLKGVDWLDKPHFQFWPSAFAYHIFGINDVGYKLPSVLMFGLGVWYTYLFGKKFYTQKHGIAAAIILATAIHILLSNNDVRAEPILTGFTMMAMFHMAVFLQAKQWKHLLWSCVAMGILMMTKGPYTIFPVAAAVFFALVFDKDVKGIFHWRWLVTGALTLLFTLPSLMCYYYQFDMHPEKEVFGETQVSGVRFFLWDSQWGRFNNTGPIKGEGDPTFFLHTLLWAFAPWAFFAYHALFLKIKGLVAKTNTHETYTFFGFLMFFIILSASKFQLPHYINQVFPFLAILTANTLLSIDKKGLKVYRAISYVQFGLLMLAVVLLSYFFLGSLPTFDTILMLVIGSILFFVSMKQFRTSYYSILIGNALTVLAVFYFMNRDFYPTLLKYQSDSEVVFYMEDNELPTEELVALERLKWAPDFYAKRIVPEYYLNKDFNNDLISNKYVFTGEKGLNYIREQRIDYAQIKEFEDFHVTTLNGTFLNRKTRSKATGVSYLLKVGN